MHMFFMSHLRMTPCQLASWLILNFWILTLATECFTNCQKKDQKKLENICNRAQHNIFESGINSWRGALDAGKVQDD